MWLWGQEDASGVKQSFVSSQSLKLLRRAGLVLKSQGVVLHSAKQCKSWTTR